jgi:hypothetical protein
MSHDCDECDDEVAAGANCPVPDCGALVVSYRPSDKAMGRDDAEPWEFTCPRCGIDFAVSEGDLIFQSVPKGWLLAKVHAASS